MIVSSPRGLKCSSNCKAEYPRGTRLALRAIPSDSAEFTGWEGADCGGRGVCFIEISDDVTVTATFRAIGPERSTPETFDRAVLGFTSLMPDADVYVVYAGNASYVVAREDGAASETIVATLISKGDPWNAWNHTLAARRVNGELMLAGVFSEKLELHVGAAVSNAQAPTLGSTDENAAHFLARIRDGVPSLERIDVEFSDDALAWGDTAAFLPSGEVIIAREASLRCYSPAQRAIRWRVDASRRGPALVKADAGGVVVLSQAPPSDALSELVWRVETYSQDGARLQSTLVSDISFPLAVELGASTVVMAAISSQGIGEGIPTRTSIIALDRETGSTRWRIEIPETAPWPAPVIAIGDDAVYVAGIRADVPSAESLAAAEAPQGPDAPGGWRAEATRSIFVTKLSTSGDRVWSTATRIAGPEPRLVAASAASLEEGERLVTVRGETDTKRFMWTLKEPKGAAPAGRRAR